VYSSFFSKDSEHSTLKDSFANDDSYIDSDSDSINMSKQFETKTAEYFQVLNPATGAKLADVPDMKIDLVRQAISRAKDALTDIQKLTIAQRSRLLLQAAERIRAQAEQLSLLMTDEIGRPIKSSRGEIQRTAQIFELAAFEVRRVFEGEFIPLEAYDYPAGNEKRLAFVKREPVGVVGSITPFNFPASSFAHKVAPALAVGNTVVHKPTILAPLTQIAIGKILQDVGFPEGSINIVTGNSRIIGDEFISNPEVSLITFTGSASVGLSLASRAIANSKKVVMELGGSDAQIILNDADISKAVAAAAVGRFDYAGQFCNATKRAIVAREISEEFTDALVSKIRMMKVGDPRSPDTDIGPLISDSAVNLMKEFVDEAKSSGADIVFQGKAPSQGFYFPPTVIKAKSRLKSTTEEVFGPIFPIIEVSSDEDAVTVANSTPYGLDASIFSRDFSRAYLLASRLRVGTVMINDMTRLRWDNLPFGGVKSSGIGRESVRDTMREMTETKVIAYTLG
jgi:succinyl-CoA reductase